MVSLRSCIVLPGSGDDIPDVGFPVTFVQRIQSDEGLLVFSPDCGMLPWLDFLAGSFHSSDKILKILWLLRQEPVDIPADAGTYIFSFREGGPLFPL